MCFIFNSEHTNVNKTSFKVIYTNADSLLNKMDEL